MVKYTLVYFNAKGRAELARLLFAQAGVEYEDKRIQREDWASLKSSVPTGQMPYMEVDGLKLCQSMAIARHLAREFSLYGANNLEAAKIDMILDTLTDMVDAGVRVRFSEEAQKEKLKESLKEKVKITFKVLSDALKESGSGFLIGSTVTVADLSAYCYISMFLNNPEMEEAVKRCAGLQELIDKVADLPNIKAWIAKRPETEF